MIWIITRCEKNTLWKIRREKIRTTQCLEDNLPMKKEEKKITAQDIEEKEYSILNLGPTHPATHGIFQNVLTMDGEIIHDAVPTIGYIHRAFEKIAENRPFYQITPLTDRMNYCSSPINNMGWWLTVEK